MDQIRKGMRAVSEAFLPVNPFAGKLRALLGILLLFILWTFNAQNRSLPVDGFIRPQPQGGFIANVLLDLAGRYFHPATLGLTFIPCILFFLARQQTALLLRQVTETDIKTAQKFLDRCAFSSNAVSIAARDGSRQARDPHALSVWTFGGPAKVSVSATEYMILRSSMIQRYQLVDCAANDRPCALLLAHHEYIAGTIPFSNLTFPLSEADAREFGRLKLRIIPPENATHTGLIGMQEISIADARFLLETLNPGRVILPSIRPAIRRFLDTQDEGLPASTAVSKHSPCGRRSQPLKKHFCYAQTTALFLPGKKWFARPRKHTLHTGAIPAGVAASSTIQPLTDQVLIGLEAHLQREMVSFFNLDKIKFTIENRGNE